MELLNIGEPIKCTCGAYEDFVCRWGEPKCNFNFEEAINNVLAALNAPNDDTEK